MDEPVTGADDRMVTLPTARNRGSAAPTWNEIEEGLWISRSRKSLMGVIERRSDGQYVLLFDHDKNRGPFSSLCEAMDAGQISSAVA